MLTKPDLDPFFNPESIAVIGATSVKPQGRWPGMFGCIVEYGYSGRLYPINPKADEIQGWKAYPSISALPEPVDLVILSIPAPAVPETLRECAATGNRNIHIFTAGFKETGEPEGLRLHQEIEEIARENDLKVIGPNCMGVFVPGNRIATWVKPPESVGGVAFLSQSGGNAQDFANAGARLGLGYSKVVSYGNALTLDAPDFLTYLAEDPETEVIAMYLEGVTDGRRLLETVRAVNQVKPVVILKAGLTESGTRAVASHTGSMAGKSHIWEAFFRQSGAIQVSSLQEMAQVVLALQRLKRVTGNRVAILGAGGGVGVEAADACSRAGISLPALPETVQKKLREYVGPAGNMIKNPIDAFIVLLNFELLSRTLNTISSEPCFDMVIISVHLDWIYDIDDNGGYIDQFADYMSGTACKHMNGKPLVVCWRTSRLDSRIFEHGSRMEQIMLDGGLPVYRDLSQTAAALARLNRYSRLNAERWNQN